MPGPSSSIRNNSILLLISRVLAKLATIGVVVLSARTLGVAEFGMFNSVLAVAVFAGIISEFGLLLPTIRSVANSGNGNGALLSGSMPFRILLSVVSCAGTVLTGMFLGLEVHIVLLLSVASVFELNGTTFIRVFEGVNEFRVVSYYTVLERLLYGALTIGSLVAFGSVTALAVSILITHTIYVLMALNMFQRRFGSIRLDFSSVDFRLYAKTGLPFLVTTVFSSLYYKIDTVLIGHYTTMQDVGIYNAAMRVIDAQMMVPITLMVSIFPQLSQLYHQKSDQYAGKLQKYFLYMVVLGGLTAGVTWAGAGQIISILFSNDYVPSVEILQILSVMMMFFFINSLLFQTLVAMHKELVFTGIMSASAILSMAGNLWILPRYGIEGAAWLRVGIELSSCLSAGFIVYRIVFIKTAQPAKP